MKCVDVFNWLGDLPVVKVGVLVRLETKQADLPKYLGSTWRGVIGSSLQALICPFMPTPRSAQCTIKKYCPYFELFEKNSSLPGFNNVPRAYVFYPQKYGEDQLGLEITLFGYATKFVPALLKAVEKAQKTGLGAKRVPFELVSVFEILPDCGLNQLDLDLDKLRLKGPHSLVSWFRPYHGLDVEVNLVTPLRLRQKGKYLTRIDWPFFFLTLAKRLEALNVFFNDKPQLGKELWLELKEQLSTVKVEQENLIWTPLKRYSNRQKQKIPLNGLTGRAIVRSLTPWWWKWWQLAEIIYVGKGANMGLGKISIRELRP